MRAVPSSALDLIISFEQFRACCYKPTPKDRPTIGFGHTKGLAPADVGHVTITMARARSYLADDMSEAQANLEAKLGADVVARLSDKQYAALLCFVFNAGVGDPEKPEWTIWAKVKAGDDAAVPGQLARFVRCGGQVLNGLIRRRAAEAALWVGNSVSLPAPIVPPIGTVTAPVIAPQAPAITQAPLPTLPPIVQQTLLGLANRIFGFLFRLVAKALGAK